MHLSKQDSRERWRQIRALWNEWDPIGVAHSVQDEYEAYLGPTLRLLERAAPLPDLERYLSEVALERMGLTDSEQASCARVQFARQLYDWYQLNWPHSHV
jgi:hypothetical protein